MKVHKIISFYMPWRHTVVQFSPIRSGSTLLFNLLREISPKASIEKQHTYGWFFDHLKVVSSVRHPFDCIGSIHQAHKKEPTMETVAWASKRFLDNDGSDAVRVKDKDNVLVLRYESFVDDYDVIFDALEGFVGIEISESQRDDLNKRFSRDGVRKIMADKNNFFEWDKETRIHGDHISKRNGQCGYGKEIFTPEQQESIADHCAEYMKAFGYE